MFLSHPEGCCDAVLMDMRMPETDGLETTITIRRADRPDVKTLPIIALIVNALDEDGRHLTEEGRLRFV